MILDGFGLNDKTEGNAVAQAKKPNIDALMREYPFVKGNASGLAVGLPDGQMGNSEVGHLNIGAGRVVYQDLVKINRACADNSDSEKSGNHFGFLLCKGKRKECAFHGTDFQRWRT